MDCVRESLACIGQSLKMPSVTDQGEIHILHGCDLLCQILNLMGGFVEQFAGLLPIEPVDHLKCDAATAVRRRNEVCTVLV